MSSFNNTPTQLLFLLLALLSITSSLATMRSNHARAFAPTASEPHGPIADISQACSTAKDRDFCVTSLKSTPQSSNCDIRELTFLSMEMAQNKSTEIDGFIATKLRNEEALDDNVDDALNECSDAYDDATAVIEDAITAFFQKNYADVRKFMSAAMSLGDKCEKEFTDAKMKAVMGDRNLVFSKLCGNTLALVDAWQKTN